MPRAILAETQLHPAIRLYVAEHHADLIAEVMTAVAAHRVVGVGGAQDLDRPLSKGEIAGRP